MIIKLLSDHRHSHQNLPHKSFLCILLESLSRLKVIRDQNLVLPLRFEDITLQDTAQHKHLRIILQNNCKWDEHIRSIASKVNLLISCLRSYKYRLTRKTLETMYKSFILPHFDYADVVWDNCTAKLSICQKTYTLKGLG